MKITIHGSGYVGLVTGACFAHLGNDVLCIDVSAERIARLQRGEVPIHEPGLTEMIAACTRAGTLAFSTDPVAGVRHAEVQFIAVGTPPDEDGSADLRYVMQVAETIARHMDGPRLIVDKSTVPVGTADQVRSLVATTLAGRGLDLAFDVVSNPEFLKEGAAIRDFMQPDRVIVGASDARSIATLRELYAPFVPEAERFVVMRARDAEFTKYAANAMLATRISTMNEFANIADRLGVDIEAVRLGIGSDPRIGPHFLLAGPGYGGSCFPKDVQALIRMAHRAGYTPRLIEAVEAVNASQKRLMLEQMQAHFGGDLTGRVVALWGLAFKPNTDDMREAPSRTLLEGLWATGATVRAYDPEAMVETRRIYGERPDLVLCSDPWQALDGADALAIVTEWADFRGVDPAAIRARLRTPVLFDGRNVCDPARVAAAGLTHYSIGRPTRRLAD